MRQQVLLLLFLYLWSSVNANDCLIACTREMKPVCAETNSGELGTFPNACNLVVRQCEEPQKNWRYLRSGPCAFDE
ncbi:hypothetical protein QE152_g26059 [Popillia japonica]|uniref:Kazal-like domain-containing protein n=1 Tax=Popillia japonica TaxID=7064 RepID=A0AAW1JZH1_POPJA